MQAKGEGINNKSYIREKCVQMKLKRFQLLFDAPNNSDCWRASW